MTKLLQPVAAAIMLGVVALVAVWTGEPILVPSLGSAIFTEIYTASEPSASFYSIGVGQLAGLVGGFVGVTVALAASAPSFMGHHPLVYARVLAVLAAVVVAGALQMLLKAVSPAGGATALVVALGTETADWHGAGRMLVGIALATSLGEVARRLVLRSETAVARP